MAGSSTAKTGGTGIPGPIMSILQEGSRHLKKGDPDAQIRIQKYLDDAFKGKLKGQNGVPFDLRTELGVYNHLGKQALVVGINEAMVRAFYFIRHLIVEIRTNNITSFKELKKVNWMNTLPFKNRTIIRMLTISMASLTAIDTLDAAIRAAINSGGNGYTFLGQIALRINYIGLGRTVMACSWDGVLGAQLSYNRKERIEMYNEYVALNNAKMFYKQGDLWRNAEDVDKSIEYTIDMVKQNQKFIQTSIMATKEDLKLIGDSVNKIDKNNEGLSKDIKDMLKWGL